MTLAQRILLIVAALFMLLFAANTATSFDPKPTLATAQFLGAVGLLFAAARRAKA